VSAGDETVLCFDYGARRIGVAVGQTVTRTAGPLATLSARQGQPDWAALARLVAEWRPERFVVGLPTTADGAPHPLRAAIERFARRLEGRFRRPVEFVDERLSSWAAAADAGDGRHGVDALAAARILETWLGQTRPTPTPQPPEAR
jgi:putative Holliday junction resolvase